jgi:sulfoxide reductase heme-binding subunit YedZ
MVVVRRVQSGIRAVAEWRFFKPLVFVACALPLADFSYHTWLALTGRDPMALGVDPVKAMLHQTGETSLTLLLVTLSVTPLRRLTGVSRLQSVRRMLGVWSFAYAAVHLSIYLHFDQLCLTEQGCQVDAIVQDILKRRFIFAGQLAFAILTVLAITSTAGWMRRLKKNWVRLHRLVYLAAASAVVHFIWIQKSDISLPMRWAIWLSVLLVIRLIWAVRRRAQRAQRPVTA